MKKTNYVRKNGKRYTGTKHGPAFDKRLVEHWHTGMSTKQMGVELSAEFHIVPELSKNAIIGYTNRLHLDARASPIIKRKNPKTPPPIDPVAQGIWQDWFNKLSQNAKRAAATAQHQSGCIAATGPMWCCICGASSPIKLPRHDTARRSKQVMPSAAAMVLAALASDHPDAEPEDEIGDPDAGEADVEEDGGEDEADAGEDGEDGEADTGDNGETEDSGVADLGDYAYEPMEARARLVNSCQWPTGQNGRTMMVCGKPVEQRRSPYCDACRKSAYAKIPPREVDDGAHIPISRRLLKNVNDMWA